MKSNFSKVGHRLFGKNANIELEYGLVHPIRVRHNFSTRNISVSTCVLGIDP